MKTMIVDLSIALQIAFLLFCHCKSYAQEQGFLTRFSEEDHSWFVTDALESPNGYFLISAYDNWGASSLLLKLSAEGDVVAMTTVAAEDTTVYAYRLLQMPKESHSEYAVLCPSHPNDGSTAALLFMRIDEDLNITYRKTIPCSFFDDGSKFYSAKFLLSDACIFGALTSRLQSSPQSVFLTKFDLDGNILGFQRDSLNSVCNLFQAEEGRIGLFGRIGPLHMGFLAFDSSLQLVGRDTIFNWSTLEGDNGDFCLYSISDHINSQGTLLPDGSHIVSARLFESLCHANGYPYKDDRSAILSKYSDDFHQPENMLVIEHMNDSLEYPAFFRSMDFRETDEMECEVFQCSILNELPQYGLLQPLPTGIVVTKTGQDLNVVWKKRFLRDGNYQAMAINATADGGCLVVGSVGDYQAQRFDVFALKINANGTVGLEEVEEEALHPYVYYPNPARDELRLRYSPDVQPKQIELYDLQGRLVRSQSTGLENLDMEGLPAGTYTMRVTMEGGRTFSDKVVKE